MIKVSVPATSANLGVGYDCLGLAIDLFMHCYFEEKSSGVIIEGLDAAFCNEENLIYQAFTKTLKHLDKSVKGISIKVQSDVPFARGLGSSACCIVAGIQGANALFGSPLNKYDIFKIATDMEGHPDNVAPAIFGGLCVSFIEDSTPYMMKFVPHKELFFVSIIPNYSLLTQEAREILPNILSYDLATYHMGRCCALAKAIEIKNTMIIEKASHDLLHEPYRKTQIPEYESIKQDAQQIGISIIFISGSGPSLLAIAFDVEKAQKLMQEIPKKCENFQVKIVKPVENGLRSEVIE